MSKLAAIQAAAAQAAQTGPDMTEKQTGGTSRLLPDGYAFGRLVEYVELGSQPQEYQGKAKDPLPEAKLAFALWGQGYANEDGTPYIIRPYAFSISRNEKAKAFKLFKALNWKGTHTHFAQMVGEAFLVKIVNEPKSKTDPALVSRIDFNGFLPPLDPVTRGPYAIPEAREEDLQMFLFDYPTQESWDALYMEGNWDDGRSKNYVQETIVGATDFSGSALEAMLAQSGKPIPKAAAKVAAPVQAALPSVLVQPVVPAVPLAPAVTPAPVVVPPPVVIPVTVPPVVQPVGLQTTSPSEVAPVESAALPSLPAVPVMAPLPIPA